MTAFDDVLLWISEMESGSLAELRAVIEHSVGISEGRSTYDRVRDLQVLGHVEVDAGRWHVAAPLMSVLADGGGNAVMVGSRPAWLTSLMSDLDAASDPVLQELADYVYENVEVPQDGPSTWYVAAGRDAPLAALASVGISVLEDAAGAIVDSLRRDGPRVLARDVRPGELVGRLEVSAPVARSAPEFFPCSDDRAPGFYRYLRLNQRVHAARADGRWVEIDQGWGTWRAIPRTHLRLRHSPRERTLYLPSAIRPPVDVERALVMRSGRLPATAPAPAGIGLDGHVTSYINVTSRFAESVADLLDKDVEFV